MSDELTAAEKRAKYGTTDFWPPGPLVGSSTTVNEKYLESKISTLSARCDELERRLTGAWVVMELEWREIGKSLFRANTPLGPVIINFCRDGWFVNSNDSGITATYPSLDAAKAAAQEWFNEKMTAGLRRVGGQQ